MTDAAPSTPPRRRFRLITRRAVYRLVILFVLIALGLAIAWRMMISMPGSSFRGPLPAATEPQRALAAELKKDVETLAGGIGYRSIFHARKIADAAAYLHGELGAAGYAKITEYPVDRAPTPTLEVTVSGTSNAAEIIVVGAHYDSCQTTPGADDNASGVAAVLALARRFAARPQARSLRFVLFVGEEPPLFETDNMGSLVYAKSCRKRADNIVAMLSLETIAYYSTAPGSQKYPPPFGSLYPDTGDFIGFIGNVGNRSLVKRCIGSFRAAAQFPSEGAAIPEYFPGVGWSDHWAFWQEGYPAIMVSDTAPFRNPNYHQPSDKPDTLDYERMARVVEGLERVIADLASGSGK